MSSAVRTIGKALRGAGAGELGLLREAGRGAVTGRVGRGIRETGKFTRDFPVTAAGGGIFLGEMFGPGLIAPFRDPLRQQVRQEVEMGREGRLRRMKAERLQRMMAVTAARLAAMQPHTYNELLAQTRLPQGAVVLGGQRQPDLLNQVLAVAVTGGFDPPRTATQDFVDEIIT
jgi:hypothetical protein